MSIGVIKEDPFYIFSSNFLTLFANEESVTSCNKQECVKTFYNIKVCKLYHHILGCVPLVILLALHPLMCALNNHLYSFIVNILSEKTNLSHVVSYMLDNFKAVSRPVGMNRE